MGIFASPNCLRRTAKVSRARAWVPTLTLIVLIKPQKYHLRGLRHTMRQSVGLANLRKQRRPTDDIYIYIYRKYSVLREKRTTCFFSPEGEEGKPCVRWDSSDAEVVQETGADGRVVPPQWHGGRGLFPSSSYSCSPSLSSFSWNATASASFAASPGTAPFLTSAPR